MAFSASTRLRGWTPLTTPRPHHYAEGSLLTGPCVQDVSGEGKGIGKGQPQSEGSRSTVLLCSGTPDLITRPVEGGPHHRGTHAWG